MSFDIDRFISACDRGDVRYVQENMIGLLVFTRERILDIDSNLDKMTAKYKTLMKENEELRAQLDALKKAPLPYTRRIEP